MVVQALMAERPNQLWVSDFTYVSTWQGWLCLIQAYLAACPARSTSPLFLQSQAPSEDVHSLRATC